MDPSGVTNKFVRAGKPDLGWIRHDPECDATYVIPAAIVHMAGIYLFVAQ